MKTEIHAEKMSHEQLARLCHHLLRRDKKLTTDIETFFSKMDKAGELSLQHRYVMNEFAAFLRNFIKASDEEIERIVGNAISTAPLN